MTVQELIDKLQQLENKNALVVDYDHEYGCYSDIKHIYCFSIPDTYDNSDDDRPNVKRIEVITMC